ncbi:hypothetical protein HPB47_021625 [Ixodes persulcatus]|uniref:Uncharacterized protein n=1 Tax=Ixodes persulcatus TaxID=34615 RepID=A0AC60QEL0_IXOPE|nr:hypothetical protein HPB47_021625 [Ixodes persulcatus]
MNALENTYVISHMSKSDIISVLSHLGKVRALLPVQMSSQEEEVMRKSLWALVNNRIFFQHPDLIRILRVNENVMDVMINTLGKRAQTQSSGQAPPAAAPAPASAPGQAAEAPHANKDTSHEMVVSCCRFLCYFCRTSRQNQKAMFDHLDFLLENSNILLSRPSLRGSTPLDVAYSSLMENSELALALREHYLEKIAAYMSRCGLQSNLELIDRGYPDVGWDPVEGERYLDFLRFCVWVNGLLDAIREAVRMSERIVAERQQQAQAQGAAADEEESEDDIDMGAAILNFYCTLVDLLGRCAPEAATIAQGKNECVRARAILRSLVPLDDLLGALSLRFTLQTPRKGESGKTKSDLPPGLQPNHKQSIVMFLERVYGLETQDIFFRLLEDGFLPDLRAATMLDRTDNTESDMALALNRYIGNSVLPMLIQYYSYFSNAENYASLLDATLHTVYRLSKVKILTKGQREKVSDFLVALTSQRRRERAEDLLQSRTQGPNESVMSFVEDVPRLSSRANFQATEEKKLRILMRDVKDDIFCGLVRNPPTTVQRFVMEATNIERALQARASHYQRLPGVNAVPQFPCDLAHGIPGIRELNRDVVREELKTLLPTAERPASISIAEAVRDEFQRVFLPYAPVTVAAADEPTLTYAAVARRPPPAAQHYRVAPRRDSPTQAYPRRNDEGRQYDHRDQPAPRKTDVWRAADRRPLFYHCGEPDHIYRRCPYRRLGLRGFHPNDPRPRYGEHPREIDEYLRRPQSPEPASR